MGFPGSVVKNLPAVQELQCVQSLGGKGSLETEMAPHSSILTWKIPRTEGTGGLQSKGLQRVRNTTSTFSLNTLINSKHSLKHQLNDSCSAVSDSLWSHGLYSTRLLCQCDSPGKNTGVGYHSLFQGIVPGLGIKPGSRALQADFSLSDWGFGYQWNGSIRFQATCNLLL